MKNWICGYRINKFARPKQVNPIWRIWPRGIPIKWGNVLKKPNFRPDVVSIALLGPGVMNIVK